MYKAILFDMDGTVLDTLTGLTVSLNHILHQFSLPEKSQSQVRDYLGYGYIGLWRQAVPDASPEQLERYIHAFKKYYGAHCCEASHFFPGIADTLASLRDNGYKMAIVSNKGQGAVNELHHAFFEGLVPFSMGESEHYRKKPAPDMLWEALKRLGCAKEDAIYVGDSEVDSKTAKAAGLDCALVTWGFRDKEYLATLYHTYMVQTPAELKQIFM